MEEDIEDILRSVEDTILTPTSIVKPTTGNRTNNGDGRQKNTLNANYTSNPKLSINDDLDDLLNELDDDISTDHNQKTNSGNKLSQKSTARLAQPVASSNPAGSSRCLIVYIGGSQCPEGLSTAVNKRACDKLRCTACDFDVSSFENCQWHKSTDYLFLRNNMPEFIKVKSKLIGKSGFRAYACQCQWNSVKDFYEIGKDSQYKWVCGKH